MSSSVKSSSFPNSFHHLCIIGNNLYTAGWNQHHQLGIEESVIHEANLTKININFKEILKSDTEESFGDYVAVAAGNDHSLVLTSNGKVLGWGSNMNGQLGKLGTSHFIKPISVEIDKTITTIACCSESSFALSIDGDVYSWGSNGCGQLGQGHLSFDYVPKKVEGIENVISIACGNNHILALTRDGKLYSWGSNKFGQLGHGDIIDSSSPFLVNYNFDKIKTISCGSFHSFALQENGKLFGWGANALGQLGDGTNRNVNTPKHIPVPSNDGEESEKCQYLEIACGGSHSLVLTKDGEMYSWGYNKHGQLGNAQLDTKEMKPQNVIFFSNSKVTTIGCTICSSYAITEDGNLFSWGWNKYGQLGLGDTDPRTIPSSVDHPDPAFPVCWTKSIGNITTTMFH
eukprot:TRINITY_DN637_c2_g1_i3.p1 TRINITY_DN637_c2_g1~~TRINITY_DN637_c2_g1_i3.p1  ORF type:complete len:401 (-),score=46.61 TRINITY_DN637_c2_g1_i3:37-1239(-)